MERDRLIFDFVQPQNVCDHLRQIPGSSSLRFQVFAPGLVVQRIVFQGAGVVLADGKGRLELKGKEILPPGKAAADRLDHVIVDPHLIPFLLGAVVVSGRHKENGDLPVNTRTAAANSKPSMSGIIISEILSALMVARFIISKASRRFLRGAQTTHYTRKIFIPHLLPHSPRWRV